MFMMSTVEKPQKDSIREGWKMNERLSFSSQ
uniref:Ubiquinol-cytochrome c reductase complex assembly factor 5 n=1 Tax=Microcebus murinus TaxID=30608 RepID=A0A8C6EC95_MICMU